jgi:tetratricopeptide (TPR) repeat protein
VSPNWPDGSSVTRPLSGAQRAAVRTECAVTAALELRDHQTAVEAAEQILQLDEKDDLALLLTAAQSYLQQKRLVLGSYFIGKAPKYVKGGSEAAVLFYLGWASYNMEKYEQAFPYFAQCTKYEGHNGEQAVPNMKVLRSGGRVPQWPRSSD